MRRQIQQCLDFSCGTQDGVDVDPVHSWEFIDEPV
jgi:hypothetical protein